MVPRITRAAEGAIIAVLLESARTHGKEAADRYRLLILTAMQAIGENPGLAGSAGIPGLPGVRAFMMRSSRFRIEPARRVRSPRHVLVYRVAVDGVVEILALVHDRMLLSRAARRAVRDADRT
ncbi:MAG: type II toxin-antitoxin system RelE/ParE family toxin [Rhodospirillales bacterium]|nr:type II toxin-antitoxin system RelE/ParE family toxin [Rhodospirillales bacterium]